MERAVTPLEFKFLLRTGTGCNLREHWAVRAKRVKRERQYTSQNYLAHAAYPLRADLRLAAQHAPGLLVTLTRIGPQLADDDNLPAGLKAVRDQLAEELGTHDGPTSMLHWQYRQERGTWGVGVRIEEAA